MTEPAKLHVEGPYDLDGNKTGPDLDLFLGQEASDDASTDSKARSIPTQDDSKAVLAPLSGEREIRYQGRASGQRLHMAGFGSGPEDGLVEWLIHLESLMASEQGGGYKVTDDVRGETYDPTSGGTGILFSDIRWNYEAGKGHVAEWEVEGQLGEGMQNAADRQQYIDDEKAARGNVSTDRLKATDGSLSYPLGEIQNRRYERSVDLDIMNIMHQYDVPVVGLAKTGVQGNVMLEGRVTRNDVDLKTFSRELNDEFHGIEVQFEDALTDRTLTGAIEDTSTKFEAGTPDILEYRVELRVGEVVTASSSS